MDLEQIKSPIEEPMMLFEKKFKDFMKSDVKLIDTVMNYIVKSKGKQIRPMFVFLTTGMLGAINDKTYRGAALIELLHTATLVHDDVVDDANKRRGFFSVNAIWKNKIAVLVGDYLFSRGMIMSIENEDFLMFKQVALAVKTMAEGELLQFEKARKLDISEEVYYDIIRAKTASLIASCCAVGAASIDSDPERVEEMRLFGERVGMAYQIKDDLFDYGDDFIGKPLGIDIKEKKMTLPLIYALQNCEKSERKRIIRIIKKESHKRKKVKEVISFVRESGGMPYAEAKMNEYMDAALEMLKSFPESAYRTSLANLVQFAIKRKL